MRKLLPVILFFQLLTAPVALFAQYRVRFIVSDLSPLPHDSIYLTGSFNNWDSTAKPAYRLHRLNGKQKTIELFVKKGKYEYKFHRGSWRTVEKKYFGWEVNNRVVNISKDTILNDTIEAWKDQLLQEKWFALSQQQPDTIRVLLLSSLATIYGFASDYYNVDSALSYSGKALVLLQGMKASPSFTATMAKRYVYYLFNVQETAAALLHSLGNYTKSLELRLDNLRLAQGDNNRHYEIFALESMRSDYAAMKDYDNELKCSNRLQLLLGKLKQPLERGTEFIALSALKGKANAFFHLEQLDSSLYYTRLLAQLACAYNLLPNLAASHLLLGSIYAKKNDHPAAIRHYRISIQYAKTSYQFPVLVRSHEGLAKLYQRQGNIDSALFYAKAALAALQNKAYIQSWGENTETFIADVTPLLAHLYYTNHQSDSAYKYLRLSVDVKDSLYNLDKVRQFQNINFNEMVKQQLQQQQETMARQQLTTRIKFILLLTGMLAAFIVALLLYKNNRQKQKANSLLQQQKRDTEAALEQLQLTQSQLVQKEKMASLGELTAGIAHEIKNPMNFIANFSEVTMEMLDELQQELQAGHYEQSRLIAGEARVNLQKVAVHVKRADSIIRNMMEHSRGLHGVKQATDINMLTDEYLKLAYHGFKMKNQSFTVSLETDFEPALEKVKVLPQEIGRVMLNLFNNAFYSVQQKKKALNGAYHPAVKVSTRSNNGRVEVLVKDNGTGIPCNVQNKIYQPFFTTKPSGEGTGLGLSLSYNIITKVHGGELRVESKEGEGAAFTIQLPAS